MPRIQVYPPHGLYDLVKKRHLPASELLQKAVRAARRGSAIDALVVAVAEPGGTVLTSDPNDLEALASQARRVRIERI